MSQFKKQLPFDGVSFALLIGIAMFTLYSFTFDKADAPNPDHHIYLSFGQSNMEGKGVIEEQDLKVDERFKIFQALDCPEIDRVKHQWYPAIPPLCQCDTGLGPTDYFGRTMVANLPEPITVGVVNVAVAGCDIRLFDKDIYEEYSRTKPKPWFLNKIKNYDGNPYEYLVKLAKVAQKDGVIKGILLHQGETNTGDVEWPLFVKKIYEDLLTDLDLEAEKVPLIAGEVVSVGENCCSKMNEIINVLPETIPTAHVVSSEGCTKMDRSHFDSQGYRELGSRYAQKVLSLKE